MTATPRPWVQRGETVTAHRPHVTGEYNEESIFALSRPPDERRANATLIVRAVNTFDEAKAALAACVADLQSHVPGATTTIHDAKAVLAKMEGRRIPCTSQK